MKIDTASESTPAPTKAIGFYCTVLMVLYNLAAVGLIGVPVSFILKNQLHLPPTGIANFGFLSDAPYFVGFLFGFLRDRWRPWGKGDRGYFVFVPLLMATVYVLMSLRTFTYGTILGGIIAIAALAALLGAAAQGLVAAIAKDFGMMGRLSVITLLSARGGMMYSSVVGGWLGDHTAPTVPFLISAAACLPMCLMAFWRPRWIFRSGEEVFVSVTPEDAWASVRRLFRHRAIYLPAIVIFLWEFAPGWGTPLLFYLTNTVKISESDFGASQGFLRLGTMVAALSYSWLCTRFKFVALLRWGTFLGVVGAPAFLLIHTPGQANIVSLIAGVCCGIALASYFDLLVRCCPKELEGVAFMLSAAMLSLAADSSDIFGAYLYEHGGFPLALWISTAFTALIFIPIAFVPRQIANPHEGERIVDEDPPVAA